MEDDVLIGEVRLFAFSRIPSGWLPCDGAIYNASDYTALFTLLGNAFGGNGSTTFGVPDLRGRVPIHRSDAYNRGEMVGEEAVKLTNVHLPSHSHDMWVNSNLGTQPPANSYPAEAPVKIGKMYGPTTTATMAADCVEYSGGGLPHENRQPFVTMNYLIAAEGAYPGQD